MRENRKVVLRRRPEGVPCESDFALEREAVGEPAPDHVLIEVSHLSIDAFIRTTLDEGGIHATIPLGATVPALGVGRIAASAAAGLAPGDFVFGTLRAQTHAMLPAAAVRKIDTTIAPPATYLGILGLTTGLTAYFGLLEVVHVDDGETVVVSAAAGAVGSLACQLAKLQGARVIGIAGGPEKARYVRERIGADAAIDYKNEDVGARLDVLAPEGVDVYFDNVGGELLDVVLDRLSSGARVSICGAISQYGHLSDVRGPKLYLRLAERNACMCGFTVDYYRDRFHEAVPRLVAWMNEGKLVLPEQVETGIARFPAALAALYTGGHMGKLLVRP
jgi:hypothetical protein